MKRKPKNQEMSSRYVVSKTLGKRIPCDGPLDVQVERLKLEAALKEAGKELDVEVQFVKPARTKSRSDAGRKPGYKRLR
jgi:hypothetical protein